MSLRHRINKLLIEVKEKKEKLLNKSIFVICESKEQEVEKIEELKNRSDFEYLKITVFKLYD